MATEAIPESGIRRLLGAIVIACFGLISSLLVSSSATLATFGAVILMSILSVVVVRDGKVSLAAVMLPTVFYSLGPLYAASIGDTLWPNAPLAVYESATQFMVLSLFLSCAVASAMGVFRGLDQKLRLGVAQLLDIGASTGVTVVCAIVVLTFATQSWLVALASGIGAFGGARRSFEAQLWVASDLMGQILAIVASVIVVAPALARSQWRATRIALFLALWAPFVLGGGRRIFVYAAVPVAICAIYVASKRLKVAALVLGISGATWFVIAPLFFSGGGDFAAHGEWSISGAPFVAVFSAALRASDLGAVIWPQNIVRVLPNYLGGEAGQPLADALTKTNLYTAGTSGSPWVDSWTGDFGLSLLSFISIVLVILLLTRICGKLAPAAVLFALGSMAILGRSHAPYAITTILAGTVVVGVAAVISRDKGRPSEFSTPVCGRERTQSRH